MSTELSATSGPLLNVAFFILSFMSPSTRLESNSSFVASLAISIFLFFSTFSKSLMHLSSSVNGSSGSRVLLNLFSLYFSLFFSFYSLLFLSMYLIFFSSLDCLTLKIGTQSHCLPDNKSVIKFLLSQDIILSKTKSFVSSKFFFL
jgi:hypothetical protein